MLFQALHVPLRGRNAMSRRNGGRCGSAYGRAMLHVWGISACAGAMVRTTRKP